MADYDLVIRGGSVVTAVDRMTADVGVRGDRIVALGDDLGKGRDEIDASGASWFCPVVSTAIAISSSYPRSAS